MADGRRLRGLEVRVVGRERGSRRTCVPDERRRLRDERVVQLDHPRSGGQPERDAKRLASRTARAQPPGGSPSHPPLELGLACVERVTERGIPRKRVARNLVELEQTPEERRSVLAGEVAAFDEGDGVREVCERQPAGETRAVGALGRVGRRDELGRGAAAQPPSPPKLLGPRHCRDTTA